MLRPSCAFSQMSHSSSLDYSSLELCDIREKPSLYIREIILKYWFYLFQSMLEINKIWYIIPIYNILSAQISSSPGPGVKLSPIQTFLSDLLDLKLLNSGLKCDMICQKKIGGHKITAMSLAQTPRVGYQNVGNFI